MNGYMASGSGVFLVSCGERSDMAGRLDSRRYNVTGKKKMTLIECCIV